MEEDTTVRCGYKFFSIDDPEFESACRVHDFGYGAGSDSQATMSRKDFDRLFLVHMLRVAGDRRLARMRAYCYYGFARCFGAILWEGKR